MTSPLTPKGMEEALSAAKNHAAFCDAAGYKYDQYGLVSKALLDTKEKLDSIKELDRQHCNRLQDTEKKLEELNSIMRRSMNMVLPGEIDSVDAFRLILREQREENQRLRSELLEEARLSGVGASREARLIAEKQELQKERDQLRAECDELRVVLAELPAAVSMRSPIPEVDAVLMDIYAMVKHRVERALKSQGSRVGRLVRALEFYSNKEHYEPSYSLTEGERHPSVLRDTGAIASDALKEWNS